MTPLEPPGPVATKAHAADENDRKRLGKLTGDITENVVPIRRGLEPLPFLTTERLPVFPVESLPSAVRAFVSQLSDSLEVPVDLPAVLSLGALASALQGKYQVQPRRGWRETLNLYLAVALDSGELKSPTFKSIFAPLYTHEEELKRAWDDGQKEAEQQAEAQKERGEKPAKRDALARPRLFIDESTSEAAARVMAEQGVLRFTLR